MQWQHLILAVQFAGLCACASPPPSGFSSSGYHSETPFPYPTSKPPGYLSKTPPPAYPYKTCFTNPFYFCSQEPLESSSPLSISYRHTYKTVYPAYRTVTVTASTSCTSTVTRTYIKIVGRRTKTVPIDSAFTPLISCPTTTSTPDGYVTGYLCTTTLSCFTVDKTRTLSVVTSTPVFTTYPAITSTSTVATSTAYAACGPGSGNLLDSFHGQSPLVQIQLPPFDEQGFTPPTDREQMVNRLSARTACEYAQKRNLTGWAWSANIFENDGLRAVSFWNGTWGFFQEKFTNLVTIGNGPQGKGTFLVGIQP